MYPIKSFETTVTPDMVTNTNLKSKNLALALTLTLTLLTLLTLTLKLGPRDEARILCLGEG